MLRACLSRQHRNPRRLCHHEKDSGSPGSSSSLYLRHDPKPPSNNALEPTPLSGEQDRADFETRFRLSCPAGLSMRRGSMLIVGQRLIPSRTIVSQYLCSTLLCLEITRIFCDMEHSSYLRRSFKTPTSSWRNRKISQLLGLLPICLR